MSAISWSGARCLVGSGFDGCEVLTALERREGRVVAMVAGREWYSLVVSNRGAA
jgi:hypothetical protein